MKSQKAMYKDIAAVVLGQTIGVVVLVGFFAVIDRFDETVLLGAIAGALIAALNCAFLYLFANKAADKAENQDAAGGLKLIQMSYIGRMVCTLIAWISLAGTGWCNIIALVVPLALNRPILTIYKLMRKRGIT